MNTHNVNRLFTMEPLSPLPTGATKDAERNARVSLTRNIICGADVALLLGDAFVVVFSHRLHLPTSGSHQGRNEILIGEVLLEPDCDGARSRSNKFSNSLNDTVSQSNFRSNITTSNSRACDSLCNRHDSFLFTGKVSVQARGSPYLEKRSLFVKCHGPGPLHYCGVKRQVYLFLSSASSSSNGRLDKSSPSLTMATVVASNPNVEVNLAPGEEKDGGRSYQSGLQSDLEEPTAPVQEEKPVKEDKPVKRRNLFRFRLKQGSPENSPEAPQTEDSRSPEPEEDEDNMTLFLRPGQDARQRSYIYEEEEEPALLPSDAESDEQTLIEADVAENLLGSALRLAEQGTGENFFALSRDAPRKDALELGRRVSTLNGFVAVEVNRAPSLLSTGDDERSLQSYGSHATATKFIKVPKVDPATVNPETWAEILGSLTTPSGDIAIFQSGQDEEPPREDPPEATPESLPRSARPPPNLEMAQAAMVPAQSRNWDKLRDTLQAQEKGNSVGYETQLGLLKRRKSTGSTQRASLKLGKGLRQSLGNLRRPRLLKGRGAEADDFSLSLGAVPEADADKSFDVNIRVEDLSKTLPDVSVDNTVDSEEEDQGAAPVVDRSPALDLEESESMEVVYLVNEDATDMGDILPPFPARLLE